MVPLVPALYSHNPRVRASLNVALQAPPLLYPSPGLGSWREMVIGRVLVPSEEALAFKGRRAVCGTFIGSKLSMGNFLKLLEAAWGLTCLLQRILKLSKVCDFPRPHREL